MRALWSGSISFGLINIPVKMYTAIEGRELHFDLLHKKDHSRIRYARICESEKHEVPWEEIVKGYEYQEGSYVVLTDEDFKSVELEREKIIEIHGFVDEREIDSIFFEKPYFIEADKGAGKAYALLREALHQSGKVGVTQFIFHNKKHLGILKAYENVLVLNDIRYPSEIRATENLKIPAIKVTKQEVDLALKLIDQLSTHFEPEKFHDTYTDNLLQLIEKKAKGGKIKKKKSKAVESPKVIDVMSLLKKSLEEEAPKKTASRKKRKAA